MFMILNFQYTFPKILLILLGISNSIRQHYVERLKTALSELVCVPEAV